LRDWDETGHFTIRNLDCGKFIGAVRASYSRPLAGMVSVRRKEHVIVEIAWFVLLIAGSF
jgi:hypothetical protein